MSNATLNQNVILKLWGSTANPMRTKDEAFAEQLSCYQCSSPSSFISKLHSVEQYVKWAYTVLQRKLSSESANYEQGEKHEDQQHIQYHMTPERISVPIRREKAHATRTSALRFSGSSSHVDLSHLITCKSDPEQTLIADFLTLLLMLIWCFARAPCLRRFGVW